MRSAFLMLIFGLSVSSFAYAADEFGSRFSSDAPAALANEEPAMSEEEMLEQIQNIEPAAGEEEQVPVSDEAQPQSQPEVPAADSLNPL